MLRHQEWAQGRLENAKTQFDAALRKTYREPEKARQALLRSLEERGEKAADQMRLAAERYGELKTERVRFFRWSDEEARRKAHSAAQWGSEYHQARKGAPAPEEVREVRARMARAEETVKAIPVNTYQLEQQVGEQVERLTGQEHRQLARTLTPAQMKIAQRAVGTFLRAIDPERDRSRGLGR